MSWVSSVLYSQSWKSCESLTKSLTNQEKDLREESKYGMSSRSIPSITVVLLL